MINIIKWISGCLLLLVLASPLSGVIITTVSGTYGADTYINEGKSGFNYGSVGYLDVGTADNNKIRNAYLRFDLSTLGFDPSNIGSVELTIFAAIAEDVRPDDIIGLYGIPDGSLGDGLNDWAETTITYDNAPVIINSTNNSNPLATAQIPGANAGTKNKPRFAFDAGYSFTFTSTQLLDFFRTDTNGVVTLIFQYASGGLDFMFPMAFSESIEPSYRPTLDVAEILEPAVLALVSGIGALGVVLRRRIRRGNS